jgi:zinc transport system permease protein
MILGGWSGLLLVAANSGVGEQLGEALIQGQLFFAGPVDMVAAVALTVVSLATLPWLAPRVIRARLMPHHESANQLPARRWHLSFDLLAAAAMAVATASIGVMAAFALVLAPAWLAFRVAPSWRSALLLSAVLGLLCFGAAFATALLLNQPLAPVLVGFLLLAPAGYGLWQKSP